MHRKSQQVIQEREKEFEQLRHSMTSLTVSENHHSATWPLSAGSTDQSSLCVVISMHIISTVSGQKQFGALHLVRFHLC